MIKLCRIPKKQLCNDEEIKQRRRRYFSSDALNRKQKREVAIIADELLAIYDIKTSLGRWLAIYIVAILVFAGILFCAFSIKEATFQNVTALLSFFVSIFTILLNPSFQELADLEKRRIALEAKLRAFDVDIL